MSLEIRKLFSVCSDRLIQSHQNLPLIVDSAQHNTLKDMRVKALRSCTLYILRIYC